MSQAEARSWWADVEHLREAAERRQAAEADRRAADRSRRSREAQPSTEEVRARARAAQRVRDAGNGQVDELSARRVVSAEEQRERPRRPVPIWLADETFRGDPVATARARAAAPRRTVEIRGQLVPTLQPRAPLGLPDADLRPVRRTRERTGSALGAALASRPDRVAFWAFAIGVALAIAAAATPH
jgi:hypothetical protein